MIYKCCLLLALIRIMILAILMHCMPAFVNFSQLKSTLSLGRLSQSDLFWRQKRQNLLNFLFKIQLFMISNKNMIHDIRGSQFPFGVLNVEPSHIRKILVRKRYVFNDEQSYKLLMQKIGKLKNISHKNSINLRRTDENAHSVDLLYQYVPLTLEDSFSENPQQTVKELHRQFIELAIHLAKYDISTAFNPSRCGVIINQGKSTIKYYLPLSEITITNNISVLERGVQLFSVQSMHYMDSLFQGLNTTINESFSQRTFKNRVKLFDNKERRDSQPVGFPLQANNFRKMSNNPAQNQLTQNRKLTSLSKELSEISRVHKLKRQSTRISGGSFNTFNSIVSLSNHQLNKPLKDESRLESSCKIKRAHSHQGTTAKRYKVDSAIARSKMALKCYKDLRKNISSFRGVFAIIKKIHISK